MGGDPQDEFSREDTWLKVGSQKLIREYVSFNRGSAKQSKTTCIGDHNVFVLFAVAHDCVVGSHDICNNATLGGHVQVDDHAMIGAFSAVHQFCHWFRAF